MNAFAHVLFCTYLIASLGQSPSRMDELLSQIQVLETTRQAGQELESLCKPNPKDCPDLVEQLPGMLSKPTNVVVVQSEAKLAGALKIESTIPVLAALLEKPNALEAYFSLGRHMGMVDDPVALALYEMRDASVPSIKIPLESKDTHARDRAIRLLLLINTPQSRDMLADHLASEDDKGLRGMIVGHGISDTKSTAPVEAKPKPLGT